MVGGQTVVLEDEAEDALRDGLRDHDCAQEVAVSVEVEALRRRGGEMVVRYDPLVLDFEVAIDALLKGVLEVTANCLLRSKTPELFVGLGHGSRRLTLSISGGA